jgi:glycosyltransferase involved in cell wall biosynthesis
MVGSQETGNETYCRGLLEGLAHVESDHDYFVYVSSPSALAALEGRSNIHREVLERKNSAWRLTVGFAGLTHTARLDLLHVTYNVPLFVPCPLVVSVHDISFALYPEFFSKRDLRLLSAYVPLSLRRARHVVTLSESAAHDIERVYKLPRSKISVTPLAARTTFNVRADCNETVAVHERFGLRSPYILAVGNLQPRKNLARLVEAFARLPRSCDDVKLVLAGRAQWRESQLYELIERLRLDDRVVFTGYLSDHELAVLYRGALAVAYPSLYEGFGLPILEAMACGSPVICSSTSSMPEVAGDAAILVDPYGTGEIAEALRWVIESPTLRDDLRRRGLERAALFSWESTARQTAAIYERVVEEERLRRSARRFRKAHWTGDTC